jgi:polyisoprenoid-binding protein YceI
VNRARWARIALLGAVLALGAVPASAQRYVTQSGTVSFISTAPLQSFRGTSKTLNAEVSFSSKRVSFFVDLETLDSGNARRDRDMRQNFLETARFPFAIFNGSFSADLDPATLTEAAVEVEGVFELREIRKPLVVRGTVTRVPEGIRVVASWTLALSDFGIERPRVLLYELSETLTLEIDIVLRPDSGSLR